MNDTLEDAPMQIRPDEVLLDEVNKKLLEHGYEDNGYSVYNFRTTRASTVNHETHTNHDNGNCTLFGLTMFFLFIFTILLAELQHAKNLHK